MLFFLAVSIARRLQDPFKEFLRVSPENLGIGMYQKDVPTGTLQNMTSQVIAECVALMGVDVNSVPIRILK